MKALLISAFFWYVLLAVLGTLMVSCGVALEFGASKGMMTLGVLAILGSEVVRNGMRSA